MTSYALRVPDHIMEQAKTAANEEQVSVNQMFVSFIAEGLGHRRGLKMMRDRAERSDMNAVLAILEKVPNIPPVPGDELIDVETSAAPSMK